MTGLFHSDSASSCIAPTTAVAVTGSADANKLVTLTGTGLAGGTLTIAGTLAADGRSLTNATYNVTGGTCAFWHCGPGQRGAVRLDYRSVQRDLYRPERTFTARERHAGAEPRVRHHRQLPAFRHRHVQQCVLLELCHHH